MRIIYTKDGFSKNEKEEWRIIIFHNILDGLRMTIEAMNDFNIPFENENNTVGWCAAKLLSSFQATHSRIIANHLIYSNISPW